MLKMWRVTSCRFTDCNAAARIKDARQSKVYFSFLFFHETIGCQRIKIIKKYTKAGHSVGRQQSVVASTYNISLMVREIKENNDFELMKSKGEQKYH
jgi:hypothetical protein